LAILVLLNNFLHDFSAAAWIFGAVILGAILRDSSSIGDCRQLAARIVSLVSLAMRVSLAGIVLFGGVRALAYRRYEWNDAAGEGQVPLLIAKHVLLAAVFAWGLVYYVKARKFLKANRHGTCQ